MRNYFKDGSFSRELLMSFIGTTLSIILTFGTSAYIESRQRASDRRLSALMVMGNIESYARKCEGLADRLALADTLSVWLLSLSPDSLEKIPIEDYRVIIPQICSNLGNLTHDKTAEAVFSGSIETWKNLGNFQFIETVGNCFSIMNTDEEKWNEWMKNYIGVAIKIANNRDEYKGSNLYTKYLLDEEFRNYMRQIHDNLRGYRYKTAYFRYHNRINMKLMNISEKEVNDFVDSKENYYDNGEKEPRNMDFFTPKLSVDSLKTLNSLLDSLGCQTN